MSAEALKRSEWAVITTLCGAMLGIGIASLPPELPPSLIKNNLIDISLVGAVTEPGNYRVPAGTTIRQALALTTLLEDANVQKCKWETRVRQGQVIRVPLKRSSAVNQRKRKPLKAKVKKVLIDQETLSNPKEELQVAKKRKKSKKSNSSIVENSRV